MHTRLDLGLTSAVALLVHHLCARNADNEIIVDGDAWQASLPLPIEAFFYVDGNGNAAAQARSQQQSFVNAFGVSEAEYPVVRMDLYNWLNPFSEG